MRFESSFAPGDELLCRVANTSCREWRTTNEEKRRLSHDCSRVQGCSGAGFPDKDTRRAGVLVGALASTEIDTNQEVSTKVTSPRDPKLIC